jgi:hypothetical protein
MPLNNEYKRYFIILQEDDKGYEMSAGKIPTGYAKIEIKNNKGKLTAYAQNVKYGEKIDYRMLLIAPTKKAAVDMGRLMVDGSGRGELNVEFDADSVMKSGLGISDFMVAAIQTNTATPLSGYTGRDKMQWKNSYHIINKPQDRIDKKQQLIEEVAAPVLTKPLEMPQLPMVPVEDIVEFVVGEDEVLPVPVQVVAEPIIMQPVIEEVPIPMQPVIEEEPITMQPVIEEEPITVPVPIPSPAPTPTKPKKEPVPIQVVTEPITMQPVIEEAPVPTPIPVPIYVPMPEIEPMPLPTPVTPVEILPQKPLFEAQTEIKAKFYIETEEKQAKPNYEYKIDCPEIDYKKYYYDEDCDSDSDSDSDSDCDSDDRDKNKHFDHGKNPFYTSPMYRTLEKVLGRLRGYEPFDDDDSREKWFKIENDVYLLNNATIPFMGSMMPLGYPFMSNECVMMIGRKDYIIGARYSRDNHDKKVIKSIMFGIPGMNNKHEERYYTMRGFTHYKPHKSKNYGYWIMKVDIMTGEIISK